MGILDAEGVKRHWFVAACLSDISQRTAVDECAKRATGEARSAMNPSRVVSALLTLTPFTEQHHCLDCAYIPVDIHSAGNVGIYLGRRCPDCLYVDEILANRHLAEAVRWFFDALGDVPRRPNPA